MNALKGSGFNGAYVRNALWEQDPDDKKLFKCKSCLKSLMSPAGTVKDYCQ